MRKVNIHMALWRKQDETFQNPAIVVVTSILNDKRVDVETRSLEQARRKVVPWGLGAIRVKLGMGLAGARFLSVFLSDNM